MLGTFSQTSSWYENDLAKVNVSFAVNFDCTIVVPDWTLNTVDEKGIGSVLSTLDEQVSIITPSAHRDDILIWSTELTKGGVIIEDISRTNCEPAVIPELEKL